MAFPKIDWLLKQNRESYEHFFCPACNHPIQRGPPRQHLFWTRSSLRKIPVRASPAPEAGAPYTCPVCATKLFEQCPSPTRPLLPPISLHALRATRKAQSSRATLQSDATAVRNKENN
jgi:predicted RNA-binding Zn-ribbon protein involved in translation (DUF1610 family)